MVGGQLTRNMLARSIHLKNCRLRISSGNKSEVIILIVFLLMETASQTSLGMLKKS